MNSVRPLTSIEGYVELLLSGNAGGLNESLRNYLSIVLSNANRLSNLIDNMLDLSRFEAGKMAMTFSKVDIKFLCDYIFTTMKPQAEKKNLTFQLQADSTGAVSGDLDRLQQALTNIISNAIKYTPENGIVTVQTGRRNGRIYIAVQDTGIGISAGQQKKIFQKFFRVKNDKTKNIGGTGLGLCIVKSIVESHHGRIHFESVEDQGSTFTIELPVYE